MSGFSRFGWVCTLAASLFAASCTFVPLSQDGEGVAVMTLEEASQECQRLGRTTSKTAHKVWIFPRREKTIEHELESIARNEAPNIGGTAIAPMGKATDGSQLFGIYRCLKPPSTSAEPG